MKIKIIGFAVLLLIQLSACVDEKNTLQKNVNFDRQAMLQHIGTNLILPSYEELTNSSTVFSSDVKDFITNSDIAHLESARNSFLTLYRVWQKCSVYEIGPAEQFLLRANLNTFPTDTLQIKNNIQTGQFNLGTASNIDAKGLPAIDYLLFGKSSEATINYFNTDTNAKVYLQELVNDVVQNINRVYDAWKPSGANYVQSFINKDGADVGSSLGQLVNQFNYDFEFVKNLKIGIPLGKKTLGEPLPEKTEAYYSGISSELAQLSLLNLQKLYLGIDYSGTDGLSLDDYVSATHAMYNDIPLNQKIRTQFETLIQKIKLVPDPLSETIKTNPTLVDQVYIEIQKSVVLIKTDMPSALGVIITYQDNDGD